MTRLRRILPALLCDPAWLLGLGATAVAVGLGALLLREPVGASRLFGVAAMLAGGWLAAGAGERRPTSVLRREVAR